MRRRGMDLKRDRARGGPAQTEPRGGRGGANAAADRARTGPAPAWHGGRLLSIGALALCGCATGFGEEASGTVAIALHGVGEASGGVRFDRALLGMVHVELVAGNEPAGDDGHGHAHLVRGAAAAHEAHDHHDDHGPGGPYDLLGGAVVIESIEAPVASYEALHVELETAAGGEAAGCAFFATGTAALEEETVAVRICTPAASVELPAAFAVELDRTTEMELTFALDRVLEGISLASLEREADGSIHVDATSNAGALARVRENVAAALAAHAGGGHAHEG